MAVSEKGESDILGGVRGLVVLLFVEMVGWFVVCMYVCMFSYVGACLCMVDDLLEEVGDMR